MHHPDYHDQLFNPRAWGLDAVAGLRPRQWSDWYGCVVEAQDGKSHPGPNITRLAAQWRSQLEAIRFLAVNYWNGLVQHPSNKIFAAWLPTEVVEAQVGRTGQSPKVPWNEIRSKYRDLTERGENHTPEYLTANRYLFDRAPRKRIVEWRFELRQKVQPLDPHDIDSTFGSPVLTQEVKQALCVRDRETVLDNQMTQAACDSYIQEVESCVAPVRAFAAHRLGEISAALNKSAPDSRLKRLKLLVYEIQRRDHDPTIRMQDGDHPLADYLVRLCLYLNERLCCPEDPDNASGFWKKYLLNLNQCAFMARSLYEFYGGEVIPQADGRLSHQSFFYSIPVFVPTVQDGDLPRKTSVLGMGTSKSLSEPERRGWLRVSEQLILPAQQRDLAIDQSVHGGAYAHIDPVANAWRWDLRSISRELTELETNSQHHVPRRVLADAKCAIGAGFRRSQLLRQTLKPYYDAIAQHEPLRADGFKRLDAEPDYRKAWFPMRLIALEALLRGVASERCGWVINKSDFLHLTDSDVKAELERTSPTTCWQVNLEGFDNIYVNTLMDCQPAAAWALLLEEWASNVRHHRPRLPPYQPVAEINIVPGLEGLTCNLAFGPFSQDARVPRYPVGHGSTLIGLCADVLTQHSRCKHGFDGGETNGTGKWRLVAE